MESMNGSQKCYQGSTLCSCEALRTNSYKIRITHLFGCNKFFQSVQITVNHCITEAFFSDCTRAIKFNLDLHVTQRLNWNPTIQRRAHILTGRLESWDKRHQYSLYSNCYYIDSCYTGLANRISHKQTFCLAVNDLNRVIVFGHGMFNKHNICSSSSRKKYVWKTVHERNWKGSCDITLKIINELVLSRLFMWTSIRKYVCLQLDDHKFCYGMYAWVSTKVELDFLSL